MNSLEKLILVLGAAAPPQTECMAINTKYTKKSNNATSCKTEGTRAANRITWINNRRPEDGMTDFNWTWEDCNSNLQGGPVEVFPFFPEGDKHRLTIGSTSNPDQGDGSMRPPRGRGALLTPTLFTPGLADPDPQSPRDKLDARHNEEKCKILVRHNEILYSLAIEKETELYNAGCFPYPTSAADRKKKFDKKKEDIKKDFQKNQSNIKAKKPCEKN